MIPRNIYSCHLALTGSIYTHTRTRLALTLTIYTPYLTIANTHLFFTSSNHAMTMATMTATTTVKVTMTENNQYWQFSNLRLGGF